MADLVAFSLDYMHSSMKEDVQVKLLNNALRLFCDEVVFDKCQEDKEGNLSTRKVIWKYGGYNFRASMVTFDGQVSIAEYDFASCAKPSEWFRLTTPRALAEKLTEAKWKLNG